MILKYRYEWGLVGFLLLGIVDGVPTTSASNWPVALMALLILVVGMPHGAMDVLVIRNHWRSTAGLFLSLCLYMALAVLMYFLWRLWPPVFWMIAFGLSLLHFLSIEWSLRDSAVFAPDLAFGSLFLVPILNASEFLAVMDSLNGNAFARLILTSKTIIYATFLGLIIWRLGFFKSRLRHCLLLLLSMGCFFTLGLWEAFLSFFIILHSMRHLELSFRRFPQLNVLTYWRVLLPISALSLLPVLWAFHSDQVFLARIAICLLCLTAPHFLLDEWIQRNRAP